MYISNTQDDREREKERESESESLRVTWRLHMAVTHGGYTWRLHIMDLPVGPEARRQQRQRVDARCV